MTPRHYISGVWVILGWLFVGSPVCASQPCSQARVARAFQEGVALFQRGAFREAEVCLEAAHRKDPEHEGVRYYLARTYIQLGDRGLERKNFDRQRRYYKRALEVDPRLLEDSGFVKRYRQLQLDKASGATIQRKYDPRRSPKSRLLSFGVGLTLGVEGLLGIQTGVLIVGMINPLFTFFPVQQSFDFTLRVVPLRRFAWSPYVATGVMVPLNNNPIHPLPQFQEPFIHFALGVQYISPIGFTFSSGLSLSYHFENPNKFSFIPLPSVHISWYF